MRRCNQKLLMLWSCRYPLRIQHYHTSITMRIVQGGLEVTNVEARPTGIRTASQLIWKVISCSLTSYILLAKVGNFLSSLVNSAADIYILWTCHPCFHSVSSTTIASSRILEYQTLPIYPSFSNLNMLGYQAQILRAANNDLIPSTIF